MKPSRFRHVVLVLSLLVPTAALAVALRPPGSDPKAVEIVDRMMAALGGKQAWDNTRCIRFTFIRGENQLTLTWDKWDGRYRLDATTKEGEPYVVLMNVNTREGTAYVKGQEVQGERRDELLKSALHSWAGETYWFLAPYKLQDPGVILTYEGDETIEGQAYAKLHVRFENVGLTPGDQFWLDINRDTYLMDKWRFVLESGYEGEFWWRDWSRFGELMLSTTRETPDGKAAIRMEDILVTNSLPDSVFTDPGPVSLTSSR